MTNSDNADDETPSRAGPRRKTIAVLVGVLALGASLVVGRFTCRPSPAPTDAVPSPPSPRDASATLDSSTADAPTSNDAAQEPGPGALR